jgi:hypothetical protein
VKILNEICCFLRIFTNDLIMRTPHLKISLTILILIFGLCRIQAQGMAEGNISEIKIGEISHAVHRDAKAVNTWWWGWLAGYSTATIGQGIIGIESGKLSVRQDMFLGAATTLIGAAGQFLSPVQPVKIRYLNSLKGDSVSEVELSNRYKNYLQRMNMAESKGRGWQMHLASGVVNVSSGLITWLGFKRTFRDGLLNFALNTAITEAQIWSQPVRAKKYYSKLLKQGNIEGNMYVPRETGYSVYAGAYANGMRLVINF